MTDTQHSLRIVCLGLSDPEWPVRMQRLCEQVGGKVVYWTGMEARKDDVVKQFPEVIFHNMAKAIRGIPAQEMRDIPRPALGVPLFEAMQSYQITAMKLMERMDVGGTSFTFEERLRHYYRQVEYWYSVLTHLRADLIFFPITPHANYDYIVFGLAQYLGIRTLMLDRTAIPSRVLVGHTMEASSAQLASAYQQRLASYDGGKASLPPYVETYYNHTQGGGTSALPPNMRKKIERTGINPASASAESAKMLLRYEIHRLRKYLQGRDDVKTDGYRKQKGVAPELSINTYFNACVARVKGWRIKRSLRSLYRIYECAPDFKKPFIYVPLHYQPERNSLPLGEWFADQYLMIDMLARSLPDGWKIYVKEHPQQWSYFAKGEYGRSLSFYEDIQKIPNVILVPVRLSSFRLIDAARVTATLAGSAGWESVMRGKPALVFGQAWYSGCEGVWRIRVWDECKAAIQSIANGAVVDSQKVRLFLATLNDIAIPCVIDSVREEYGDIPKDAMTEHFVNGMKPYVTRA